MFTDVVKSPVMKIKKLSPDAVMPVKAKDSDTGFDLVATSDAVITESYVQYHTGIAVELPEGYDIELRARSSISKYDLVLCNGVGTVDNGYRGELVFRFKVVPQPIVYEDNGRHYVLNINRPVNLYKKGDKVGQIVISKVYDITIQEVETLSDTERGQGGFGSSGK
jgi:dUTP pyrophosphatase